MSYKIAIFDMDGTVLNTLNDLKNSVNHALRVNGLPERSHEEIRCFLGNGMRNLISRSVPENSSDEVNEKVFRSFKEHYSVHCTDTTKPYDGIIDMLKNLKEAGIVTTLVSNKADTSVQPLCKKYFDGLLDFAVGEREGIRRKPYPDSVFEVLRVMKFEKSDACFVGDSEVDVTTAKNAGLDCIAVDWGFRDRPQLEELHPEYLCSDVKEVEKIIKGDK